MRNNNVITLVGGSGFVGRYVCKLLAKSGYTVRVICRDVPAAGFLRTQGDVGQIVPQYGDLAQPETLKGTLEGSYAVVNLVGVLFEHGKQNFSTLHAQGAEKLAKLSKAAGVKRYVHVSALGADRATAKYAKTKFLGEKATLAAFPEATILRPSVLFGPEDNFFNQFASLFRFAPIFPLIGGGKTLFQPLYVADLAKAVLQAIEAEGVAGKVYELGGPETISLQGIFDYIGELTHHRPAFVPMPFALAAFFGAFAEFLPTPPLTRDQVRLLQHDNVVSAQALTLRDLGIEPTSFRLIVPQYLERYMQTQPQVA